MAPKLGAIGAPVNDGPTVGVNTSDRNGTQTDEALEAVSSNESEGGTKGKSASANSGRSGFGGSSTGDLPADTQRMGKSNGNGNGNGNGIADGSSSSATSSQLRTDVGSLNLTAPGTSRNEASDSEDGGSVDDTDRIEQQEKLSR